MAKTKEVVMLQTVEDSWAEAVENDKGGIDRISHVDKLIAAPDGEQPIRYKLPTAQADRLIKLGYAKAARS